MSGPTDHNEKPQSPAIWFRRAGLVHRVWLAAGFVYAIGHLFLLRGPDWRISAMFILPPVAACATLSNRQASRASKAIASLFLVSVGAAVLVGTQPGLLPGVGGIAGLPVIQDRVLTLYAVVYCVFLGLIIPPCVMVAGIKRDPAQHQAGTTSKAIYWITLIAWVCVLLILIPLGVSWLLRVM